MKFSLKQNYSEICQKISTFESKYSFHVRTIGKWQSNSTTGARLCLREYGYRKVHDAERESTNSMYHLRYR